MVTTAVELIISWNHISGVNNLDTAAQLIPVAISAAYLFRGFYVWLSEAAATDPYNTTGTNTVASGSHWGGGGRQRRQWARQQRRHSHRGSSHHYDGHYMPEMTAAPSVPYATYTQQYRPPTMADAPMMDQV